jgi:hypothetical protein
MNDEPKDVYAEIFRQLEWRGPNGKPQGRIVLTREQAEQLLTVPKLITNKIDEMFAALIKHLSEPEPTPAPDDLVKTLVIGCRPNEVTGEDPPRVYPPGFTPPPTPEPDDGSGL